MPHAPCPMPYALCPMPHAPCPHVPRPTPHAPLSPPAAGQDAASPTPPVNPLNCKESPRSQLKLGRRLRQARRLSLTSRITSLTACRLPHNRYRKPHTGTLTTHISHPATGGAPAPCRDAGALRRLAHVALGDGRRPVAGDPCRCLLPSPHRLPVRIARGPPTRQALNCKEL
jgi:hypothetical protein